MQRASRLAASLTWDSSPVFTLCGYRPKIRNPKSRPSKQLISRLSRRLRVLIETLWQDIRFGVRTLIKNPMFTAVAFVTLGLGIAANTTIFSITNQVLLSNIPVYRPEELVILRSLGEKSGHVSSDGDSAASFSYPMYKELRDRTDVLTGVVARFSVSLSVAGQGQTERASGELVSGNYFQLLGVAPAYGRAFTPADETAPGANPVV